MRTVRPIETRYNGYRFRSRLEARWAVFFDAAQIAYEYELEGFTLPSGTAYLPDFYLPVFDLHVEVKPSDHIPLAEIRKVVEFAVEGDRHVLLIVGTPTQEKMFLIDRRHTPHLEEIEADVGAAGSEEDVVAIAIKELLENSSVAFASTPFSQKEQWEIVYRDLPSYPLTSEALRKAKEARFEFGESG